MNTVPSFRTLIEMIRAEKGVHQIKLPVSPTSLSPVLSTELIDFHYGVLYKNYVKKSLAGEGEFQTAGAVLHTQFFEQLQSVKSSNNPTGSSESLINEKFGSFDKFKSEFTEAALGIHGSGWVYLTTAGTIKTLSNHKITDNIAILIDMWEHAYQLDYGADKEKYLKEIWKIINWNIINARLN